ncbi:hypothetical protein Gotri_002014, partial [Gossypium trilobum]|nr:hypothetical protein [Gossypium trilobum]
MTIGLLRLADDDAPMLLKVAIRKVNEAKVFDWEGDLPLRHPDRDLIIYEMHVRGYTRHESSGTKFPGTYCGVVEKLDHLK